MRTAGPRGGRRIQIGFDVEHGTLRQARREYAGGYANICDACRPVWVRHATARSRKSRRERSKMLSSTEVLNPEDRQWVRELKRNYLAAFLRAADLQDTESWEAVRRLEGQLRELTERMRNARENS